MTEYMLRPVVALARGLATDLKWIDVNGVAEAGEDAARVLIDQMSDGMARNPGFDPARLAVKDGILHIAVPRPYGRVKLSMGPHGLRMDVSGGDHAWLAYVAGYGEAPALTLGGRGGQALTKQFIADMPAELRADVRALLAEAVF